MSKLDALYLCAVVAAFVSQIAFLLGMMKDD